MESTTPGGNGRADVILIGCAAYKRLILAEIYHTTNVFPHTASDDANQRYPETRLLWRQNLDLRRVVENVVTRIQRRIFKLDECSSYNKEIEAWMEHYIAEFGHQHAIEAWMERYLAELGNPQGQVAIESETDSGTEVDFGS